MVLCMKSMVSFNHKFTSTKKHLKSLYMHISSIIMSSSVQPSSDQFQAKLQEIKSTPNKLRRTMAAWPYYCTLKKIVDSASPNTYKMLKEVPIRSDTAIEPLDLTQ